MGMPVPKFVAKYFWGDNLNELKWQIHKKYVIQTILDKGDEKAIKWLFKKVDDKEVHDMLPDLKLSDRSRNFWETYLG